MIEKTKIIFYEYKLIFSLKIYMNDNRKRKKNTFLYWHIIHQHNFIYLFIYFRILYQIYEEKS